jgi:RNA polymerase sigma factor (sigma-70 family)
VRSADSGEFADWVGPHVGAMARLAARLAPDADRDDVVQESLVRAWRRRSTYDDARGSAQTWLLAIVADQCRKARRRLRPVATHEDLPVVDGSVDVDLERGVAALPERQRLAVSLHYFVGLSVRECAEVMACSEGTVKSTLFDARTRLRAALEVRT